ncbi:MAG: M28 family peptidase, partial [Acidobacteria bacterium]|nr:M28 family peptidase [Acidobacteriota bacterium]
GCASMLEIARALVTLTRQGKIRPPARDVQFWFTPETVGEYAYFAKFPEERRKILANLNQEMVGEDQTRLGSAAIFERAPWSLPTYLNDVLRHFVEHVFETNVGTINQHERFSDPLFAALGSRDHFFSFLVPFYTSSDHEVFAFGPVGIPAVHATCFPDYNLHTHRDTIVNVDATQLRRIALIMAAAGYFVSTADERAAPRLVNEVSAGSQMLLARMAAIAGRRVGEDAAGFSAAREVLRATVRYLAACVRSVQHFGAARLVEASAARIETYGRTAEEQLAELPGPVPEPAPSAAERQAATLRPVYAGTLAETIERRAQARSPQPRLSNPLLFEIDSLIDGRRTCLDIYRIVLAESWFGGSPYYGPVSLEQVVSRVHALVEAGAARLLP